MAEQRIYELNKVSTVFDTYTFFVDKLGDLTASQTEGTDLKAEIEALNKISSLVTVESSETVSGSPTTQTGANVEFKENIEGILDTLSRLASASGSIAADSIPLTMPTTETLLDFSIVSDSNDTDIIEFDETANTIEMKNVGRYTYLTSLTIVNNSSSTDHTATIRTKKLSDDTTLTERTVLVPKKTTQSDFRAVIYDLVEGDEPSEVYISIQSTSTDLVLNKLETTLSVGSVANLETNDNLDSITVTDSFFNTTNVVNALTTDEVIFPIPPYTQILSIRIVMFGIDTSANGTFNCKIEGVGGNVFNSAIVLDTAVAADGTGGKVSSDVNTLYNFTGSTTKDLLVFIQAGTTGNAGNGQLIITTKPV